MAKRKADVLTFEETNDDCWDELCLPPISNMAIFNPEGCKKILAVLEVSSGQNYVSSNS